MSDEEEYDYQLYGYPRRLGDSGITLPCMRAMAAILTSAFRPEKITAVIASKGEHESVLFLVWDWFAPGLTIVPDGFGTHGGEGGSGLSSVLGLIKFYRIRLRQVWLGDSKAFQALALGELPEDVFKEIVEDEIDYNWGFYPVSEVEKVRREGKQILIVKAIGGNLHWQIPLP